MFKIRENLTGRQFGKLIVLEYSYTKNKRAYWSCKCSCGNIILTRATYLKRGATISCGECNYFNFVGQQINDIKVIALEKINIIKHKFGNKRFFNWKCICKCGKIKIIDSKKLKLKGSRTFCSYSKKEYGKHVSNECFSDEEKRIWLHCLRLSHNAKRRAMLQSANGSFTFIEFLDLCKKYNFNCLRCGKKFNKLAADHVVPLSKGGSNTIENIQPLCKSCNSKKRDKIIDYR